MLPAGGNERSYSWHRRRRRVGDKLKTEGDVLEVHRHQDSTSATNLESSISDSSSLNGSSTTSGRGIIKIRFDDRERLVPLLVRSRLEETRLQVEAMQRGLGSIIPEQLMSLLTPEELEQKICGTRDIDVELLKRHTEYGPDVDPNAPHIRYLWKILREFSQHQLRRFVKFAYAQERLPSTDDGFNYPKIRMLVKSSRYASSSAGSSDGKQGGRRARQQDDALPHADTCFFNIEIPAYSSEEIMRQRLTTVVDMDWGMSGDDIGVDHTLTSMLSAPVGAAASSSSQQQRQQLSHRTRGSGIRTLGPQTPPRTPSRNNSN
eukprot:jgi/Bigna1/53732/estExt_Genewise1Plus.C_230121